MTLMRAMVLGPGARRLEDQRIEVAAPGDGQVRLRVEACGVCRTDLHIVDQELAPVRRPIVPGHQIVGRVVALGAGVVGLAVGDRVGVPWLGWTCGHCEHCLSGRENLCDRGEFTGYHRDGGFAEYAVADARFAFRLPDADSPVDLAPLLCAGLIGYRALRKTGDAQSIGLYGFGAAAHILAQVIVHQGRSVYAFTRPGDTSGQAFARDLGAAWAGDSTALPPRPLDAAIIFAPVGALVPAALAHVRRGGRVVCAGIHMSDIPSFPYELLWGERTITSVANLTRRDGDEFLDLAPRVPVRTTAHAYPLDQVNRALDDLRHGRFEGSAVIAV